MYTCLAQAVTQINVRHCTQIKSGFKTNKMNSWLFLILDLAFTLIFFVGSHTSDMSYDTYSDAIIMLKKIIPPPYVSMK